MGLKKLNKVEDPKMGRHVDVVSFGWKWLSNHHSSKLNPIKVGVLSTSLLYINVFFFFLLVEHLSFTNNPVNNLLLDLPFHYEFQGPPNNFIESAKFL